MTKERISKLIENMYCNWWNKKFEKAERQGDYRRQRQLCLSMIGRYYPEDKRDKMIENPNIKSLVVAEVADMIMDSLSNSIKNNYV